MQKVYFDNAATTPLSKEVADVMHKSNQEFFGNPSSTHSFGRSARAKIEMARKQIASVINANSSEIIFTSSGTEANNTIFQCAVNDLNIERIITSKIEHYAVIQPVLNLSKQVNIDYVEVNKDGDVDLNHLKQLLSTKKKTLVSLMHVNNEIGNVLPLESVAAICRENKALFHSDTVQSIAYYDIDVKKTGVDFLSCSAHKFHGPKGIGFLYCRDVHDISAYIRGGNQEKGLRGGTENTTGIIGLEKALSDIKTDKENQLKKLFELKDYLISQLQKNNFNFSINGNSEASSPAIINITFKTKKDVSMLLFNLDLEGVAISGGSACTSGSNKGSHVLTHIGAPMDLPAIRISFSTYNTKKEVDYLVKVFQKLLSI
tara:strand:- start:229 stop:1350 length:1122 start_codon:yes stop_codon:yes gene_type:complete